MSEKKKGRVKWFRQDKGFGFIKPLEGGEDAFVHYTCIEKQGSKNLKPGELVEYEPQKGEKGVQARKVVPINE